MPRSRASKDGSSTPSDFYEESIRLARENGFVQNEGIAGELAARFYAARGFETIAQAYLRNARYCYLRWGADGKVRQLDESYPRLRSERQHPRRQPRSARPGRTSRSHDRRQSLPGGLGRDRSGEADRHAHANRARACRSAARTADRSARRHAAARGGSDDQRRDHRGPLPTSERFAYGAARVRPPLRRADAGERDPGRRLGTEPIFRRRVHPPQSRPLRPLPAADQAGHADRCALPGE